MKFTFLLLHYKNADVTIRCIDSILTTITDQPYDIVVVDNASENGSYEELKNKYATLDNIHFLHNEENLGYARGNNVGFAYAKNELKADWICLANNDLIFNDSAWIDKIVREYEESKFYVLGPDIVTPEGVHQNPFKMRVSQKKDVIKSLLHDIVVYILLKLGIQRKLRKIISKKKQSATNAEWAKEQKNFRGVLHGSCLVFSPDYVAEFEGLYNGTFLYAEEEILCYLLNRLKYRYVYCNDVQVIHCHSTSFKLSVQDEDKRKTIIVGHRIRSYFKFLKIVCYADDVSIFLKRQIRR